jgi:hypothetical protein
MESGVYATWRCANAVVVLPVLALARTAAIATTANILGKENLANGLQGQESLIITIVRLKKARGNDISLLTTHYG